MTRNHKSLYLPELVLLLSILWSLCARADRIDIYHAEGEQDWKAYHLVVININPDEWQGKQLSDDDFKKWHAAEQILREIQKFLRGVHEEGGKDIANGGIDALILNSFENYPDPLRRLEWSDAGKPMHKVDDYFERQSLIIAVYKGERVSARTIISSVKFVISDRERLYAPVYSEYDRIVPVPLVETGANSRVNIEYENLARRRDYFSPKAMALMLATALQNRFFDFLRSSDKPARIHLNAEVGLVDYHRSMGFEVDPDYYQGMPAARMSMDARVFLGNLQKHINKLHNNVANFNVGWRQRRGWKEILLPGMRKKSKQPFCRNLFQ